MDRYQGGHHRDRLLDAGHAFRDWTTSDLFSSRTTGGNSGCPNDRGSGKLGIRSRHSRVDGPPPSEFWAMKHDGVVRISLLLTTSIVTLAALYYSRAIVAPVTFALFTIA